MNHSCYSDRFILEILKDFCHISSIPKAIEFKYKNHTYILMIYFMFSIYNILK